MKDCTKKGGSEHGGWTSGMNRGESRTWFLKCSAFPWKCKSRSSVARSWNYGRQLKVENGQGKQWITEPTRLAEYLVKFHTKEYNEQEKPREAMVHCIQGLHFFDEFSRAVLMEEAEQGNEGIRKGSTVTPAWEKEARSGDSWLVVSEKRIFSLRVLEPWVARGKTEVLLRKTHLYLRLKSWSNFSFLDWVY